VWIKSHGGGILGEEPPAAGGQLGFEGGTVRAWRIFTNFFQKKLGILSVF